MKETIYILSKTHERSSTFSGTLIRYKNLNTGISGSFKDDLMSFYEDKYNMIFEIEDNRINMTIDEQIYEANKRMEWFIDGYFIHGIPSSMWSKIPTRRIVMLYNVEMEYFRPKK